MEQTLNSRILEIINSYSDAITEVDTAIDDFKYEDLAKSIERLVLQGQIDLLNELMEESKSIDNEYKVVLYIDIEDKQIELQQQLNELV